MNWNYYNEKEVRDFGIYNTTDTSETEFVRSKIGAYCTGQCAKSKPSAGNYNYKYRPVIKDTRLDYCPDCGDALIYKRIK